MTKRGFDAENKNDRNTDRLRIMSASQYRRERLHHVPAWVADRLATRRAGLVGYRADLRALGVGRGNSAIRARVAAFEAL